jgi:multiple sugar transport system substrate-binding protein
MEDYNYGFGGAKLNFDSVKQDELITKFMDECKLYDTTYLIPFMRSSEACYVNKTIIDSIASTYGEEYRFYKVI